MSATLVLVGTYHSSVQVNVASHRALVAGPRTVQYDTTKAAVAGLTRSMARDHAEEGVRVNSVAVSGT